MKIYIKIALFVMLPVFVSAQSQQIQLDSLRVALKNAPNDTVRMDSYFQLGIFYNEINHDSSLFYLDKSIPIAQKLKLKLNEAMALDNKGYMLMKLGNYPKSLESFLQALKIAENPANEKYTWNIPKSISPRNVRIDALGFIYHNMGHLYGRTGNPDKQISNYFTTIRLAESVQDTGLLALANMNLGSVYLSLNKLDSALVFEQRALDLFSNLSFVERKYEGVTLNHIGNIYQQKGNFDLAMDAFLKAVQANTEHINFANLVYNYLSLGGLYITFKKPDSSLVYAMKALETAKRLGQPRRMANAFKFLSDVYSEQKNNDSTLKYLQLSTLLNDSLDNLEKKNLLAYQNIGFDEKIRLQKLEEEKIQTQARIRTYAMLVALAVFLVIGLILDRNNRQKRKANKVLESTLTNLKSTQSQLIQSEKMASLGELTAGIAHEIQNPLNFVNNFSEVSEELMSELKEELSNGDVEEAKAISDDVIENLSKINHHGKRASFIVNGMLEHSRTSSGEKTPTDINVLAEEFLKLSYHGLRAKDKHFNADYKTEFDKELPLVNVVAQDIGRVLLNLINNAFYACTERSRSERSRSERSRSERSRSAVKTRNALSQSTKYQPTVIITTKNYEDKIEISLKDNGPGIPDSIKDKIFQPFFTTKPTGEGTGLGLSLSYDIITKGHGGELKVETSVGEGSTFIISLPIAENKT